MLKEEVMLFVNRIAHILHSIVTQCSGSANKNIGDAFVDVEAEDDMTADEQAFLADQALLTFCKALVELGLPEFICDFSKAANDRLYARFPGYLVRIGSGLHVSGMGHRGCHRVQQEDRRLVFVATRELHGVLGELHQGLRGAASNLGAVLLQPSVRGGASVCAEGGQSARIRQRLR